MPLMICKRLHRCAVLSAVILLQSCDTPDRANSSGPQASVSARVRPLTSTNAFGQNALWSNALWSNALWSNALWSNALWSNALWSNALWSNGLWSNGLWSNALWSNALWSNALVAEALKLNSGTRQLLTYMYSCAMPKGEHVELDPNEGALECLAGPCDKGYTCSADNKCVLALDGAIGIAINADGSSWWESGQCDESCQRWVSACVLARTNAYGVAVDLSMRAPAVVPAGRELQFSRIQAALKVDDTAREREQYRLLEGAFYGNIFATRPGTLGASGEFIDQLAPQPDGTQAQVVMPTPALFACAGPASSIPDLTRRFCASEGNKRVIEVPGLCMVPDNTARSVCDSIDDTGSINGCSTQDRTHYDEVITVYLKKAIALCGNGVCEDERVTIEGETLLDPAETTDTCPDDCTPAGWVKTRQRFRLEDLQPTPLNFAVVPQDETTIVLAGIAQGPIVDIGNGVVPGTGNLVLAKLRATDGTFVWTRRFDPGVPMHEVTNVAATPSGGFVVAAAGGGGRGALLGMFDGDGSPEDGSPITLGVVTAGTDTVSPALLDIRRDGSIVVAGSLRGAVTFGTTTTPLVDDATADNDAFVVKLSPTGEPLWGATSSEPIKDLAVDAAGDVIVAVGQTSSTVYKLSGDDGRKLWDPPIESNVEVCALAVDKFDNVYTTGIDVLTKHASADGSNIWQEPTPTSFTSCNHHLGFGADDNLIYAAPFEGVLDVIAGEFDSYDTADLLVVGYSTDSVPMGSRIRWAKHIPVIHDSKFYAMRVHSLTVGGRSQVILSGVYSGSMLMDRQLNVTGNSEDREALESLLGSFLAPSVADDTVPDIGRAIAPTGEKVPTLPADIYVQATGPWGSEVFFNPPTALDGGHDGTNVVCSPRSNSLFPIGVTTVDCTASDPLGIHNRASFTVTVADKLGPLFTHLPAAVTAEATTSAGAVVTYSTPTATDQVSGRHPATCSPRSGSTFPLGASTDVTCRATDEAGNESTTTFTVTVVDTTPPELALPNPISAEATSPTGAVVNYSTSATDLVDGTIQPSCTPTSGSSFALNATTSVTCSATDAHGNTTSGSFTVTVLDAQGPVFSNVPTLVEAYATSARGAVVRYMLPTAVDATDGPRAVTCSPPSGSLFRLNKTVVECAASDAAGNRTTAAFTVWVTYESSRDDSFFLFPLGVHRDLPFLLGRPVGVRFRLAGQSARISDVHATLSVTRISDSGSESLQASGLAFSYVRQLNVYQQRLRTSGFRAGTYRLNVDLGDGVPHSRTISLSRLGVPGDWF